MNINIEMKNVAYNNVKTEEIEITENGEYLPSEGNVGFSKVDVDIQPNLEEIEITENGEYLPSEGKDGFSKVDVLVQPDTQELNVTENGEYTPDEGYIGFSKVDVLVQPDTQEIEITENGEYLPSEGYIGFSKVDVNIETHEAPLNIIMINPTSGSSVNLPITFQWNIDNLKINEVPVYYLFVDDNLVYKGNNTSFIMNYMPTSGKSHACHIMANSNIRSGFTNVISFNLSYEFLYGIDIDQDIEDPANAVTYTDECIDFVPAGLDNNNEFQFGSWKTFIDRICRPVMLRNNGDVDYELNHEMLGLKLDGTSSDISNLNYDGNAMVEFKKVYTKVWQENNIIKVRFCDAKLDSDYQAWAFINDEGDEQNAFYHSMFHAISDVSNTKLMSIANSQQSSIWKGDNKTSSSNLINNMEIGYRPLSYINAQYIRLLHLLISKTRDSTQSFGYPYKGYNSIQVNNLNTGCFSGNKLDVNTTTTMKSFYIEHFYNCGGYGYPRTILDGIYTNSQGIYQYKNHRPYPKYSDFNTAGFINSNLSRNTTGNLIKMTVKDGILFPTHLINDGSTSRTKYFTSYCDGSSSKNINFIYLSSNIDYCRSIYGMMIDGYENSFSTFITYIRPTQNNS